MLSIAVPLLIASAPAQVPSGVFQSWSPREKQPLDFVSDGVTVHVEPLPCPKQHELDSEACRYDGFSNQAVVTIGGAHVVPKTVLTDPQASYARIAVVRFDRRDARAGVIVESQSGGSGGILTVQMLVPWSNGYRILALDSYHHRWLEGQLADSPRDLSGDGRIDLVYADGAFDSAFGCNACSPRPPLVFAVRNGALVDESNDPALRPVFVADMARHAPGCLSDDPERSGTCAAYIADAARAGQFSAAWTKMLRYYPRHSRVGQQCRGRISISAPHCPDGEMPFPQALRAFLIRTGYLPHRTASPRLR